MADTSLYRDDNCELIRTQDGRYVLTVLCGGIGMFERRLELTPEEIADYEEWGMHFVQKISRRIMRDPDALGGRNGPTLSNP